MKHSDNMKVLRDIARANASLRAGVSESPGPKALGILQIHAIADVSYQLDGRFARRKGDKVLQYNARLVASAIVKELSGQQGVDVFAEEWMRLAEEGEK